jgi:hypothetical protein
MTIRTIMCIAIVGWLVVLGAEQPLHAQEDTSWILGRWSEDCRAPQALELTAREMVTYADRNSVTYRAEVRYAAGAGVVVISIRRVIMPGTDGEGPANGAMLILRRNGGRLRMIGSDDPERADADLPRPRDMLRCS